jgi:hypothetical protein
VPPKVKGRSNILYLLYEYSKYKEMLFASGRSVQFVHVALQATCGPESYVPSDSTLLPVDLRIIPHSLGVITIST